MLHIECRTSKENCKDVQESRLNIRMSDPWGIYTYISAKHGQCDTSISRPVTFLLVIYHEPLDLTLLRTCQRTLDLVESTYNRSYSQI
jgi:hypothetical protein